MTAVYIHVQKCLDRTNWPWQGRWQDTQWGENWRTVDVGRIGGGSVKHIRNSLKTKKGGTFILFIQNSQTFIGKHLQMSPFFFFLPHFPNPLFYPSPFSFLSLSLPFLCVQPIFADYLSFHFITFPWFRQITSTCSLWPCCPLLQTLIHALVTTAFECNALYLITPQGASHQRKRKQNKKRKY